MKLSDTCRIGLCKFQWAAALFFILSLASCKQEDSGKGEEGRRISEMASGIPRSSACLIDSLQSEIKWTILRNNGSSISGIFHPSRGSLILEGNSVAAGFFEGDFWNNNQVKSDNGREVRESGLKFLKDSCPKVFSNQGRILRMDLKQISRVVPRSEFRSLGSLDSNTISTHNLQLQAEIADSSQSIKIPVNIRISGKQVILSGNCLLNLRDFGILSRQIPNPAKVQWQPEARLELKLRFLKYP